jgi:hypothetical protein
MPDIFMLNTSLNGRNRGAYYSPDLHDFHGMFSGAMHVAMHSPASGKVLGQRRHCVRISAECKPWYMTCTN